MKTLREAKRISPKAAPLLRKCKRVIRHFLPDATVLVYGSLARGKAGPEPDWDILVLTEEPLSRADQDPIRNAVFAFELEHDIVVSLLFCSREDWDDPIHRVTPFYRNVQRQGVLI